MKHLVKQQFPLGVNRLMSLRTTKMKLPKYMRFREKKEIDREEGEDV